MWKRSNQENFPSRVRKRMLRLRARCASCGTSQQSSSFELDHIKPKMELGSNSISNAQWLCKYCHHEKTVGERAEGLRRSIARKRAADNYRYGVVEKL